MSLKEIWSQVRWGECNATFLIICRAKVVNYALLYGKTAFTLAKDIGVTQQAAQTFSSAYLAGSPASARSSTRRWKMRA